MFPRLTATQSFERITYPEGYFMGQVVKGDTELGFFRFNVLRLGIE
jgi:hypothetical protein